MDEILESLAEGKPEALTSMKVIFESNRTPSGITSTPFLNGLGRKLGNLLKRNDEPMEVISMVWSAGGRDYKLVAISALSALLGKIPDDVFRFASAADRYGRKIIRQGMKKLPPEYQRKLDFLLERNG